MIRILWVKRSLHARMLTPSKLLGATTGRCLYKGGHGSPPAAIPPPPPAPSPQPHHRHHVGVGRPGHHLHDQDHQVRQSHQDPQRCMNKILPHLPFGTKCRQYTTVLLWLVMMVVLKKFIICKGFTRLEATNCV